MIITKMQRILQVGLIILHYSYAFVLETKSLITTKSLSSSSSSPSSQIQPNNFSSKIFSNGSVEADKKISLDTISQQLNDAITRCQPEFIKTCKVKVGPSPEGNRLGLLATQPMKKGDIALAIPFEDQILLSPDLSLKVHKDVLPDGYDGWTGDNGLLAILILNELSRTATSDDGTGIPLPKRKPEASSLIKAWIASLPSPSEMANMHPVLWNEEDQEILQSSSTKKIYHILDDMDEDSSWLDEKIWSKDRSKFPKSVSLNGENYPCFCPEGFSWALAIVLSRSVFVEGSSRLVPVMDMANHADLGVGEVQPGYMGTFGTTKGAQFSVGGARKYEVGDEVYISYGPKSAAEYLLEHGFVTKQHRSMKTCVAELTFEIDQDDRFYDDKLDVLEFETYESAPMEPKQSFDIVSELGSEGEPDPAMIQFLRLLKLGSKDAFLLESVFRKEVWEFMSMPISEINERDVLDTIVNSCTQSLKSLEEVKGEIDETSSTSPTSLCQVVRESENKALSRTLDFVLREKEVLDLKEYYQERRLKDLGLDSEWSPEESGNDMYGDELGFGQTRAPGSLDW